MISFIFGAKSRRSHFLVFSVLNLITGITFSLLDLNFFAGFIIVFLVVRLNFISFSKVATSSYANTKLIGGLPIFLIMLGAVFPEKTEPSVFLPVFLLVMICMIIDSLLSMVQVAYKDS